MAKESKSLKAMMIADVYDRYQRELTRAGAMDFGDLLVNTLVLLKKFPDIALEYQERLKFVLVDEFQDTNLIQYEIVRILTKINRNLLVVGDDDQSIYAFRGATIQNILNFERDFPETKVIKLEENYRSTNNILNLANQLIVKNKGRKHKKLWTSNKGGEPVVYAQLNDEEEEADFIVQTITDVRTKGRKCKDIAIFYRTNAQSRAIEDALMRSKVPYKIYGGLRFYDRKEIKDIVAYLRLISNEADNQAFLRCVNTPPRGIGAQSVESVRSLAEAKSLSLMAATRELANDSKPLRAFVELIDELNRQAETAQVGDLINTTIELSQYRPKLKALKDPTVESRLENLAEFVAVGRMSNETGANKREILHKFLDKITLATSQELPQEEDGNKDKIPDVVSLMTLHLAKGLEFPVVFFTGLEEGLAPHYRAIQSGDPAEIEEERRLCYVGVTRAMEELFLSRVFSRAMFQSAGTFTSSREESRFLNDIDRAALKLLGRSRPDFSSSSDDDFSFGADSVNSWGFGGTAPVKFEPQKLGKLNIPGVIAADSLPKPKVSKKSFIAPETLSLGMRVRHELFGTGTVQSITIDPINPKVEILFDGASRSKKLLLNQAGLEVLEQ
jgi:DNA helicase-2/ATP-dependent DNA helicase PcrA